MSRKQWFVVFPSWLIWFHLNILLLLRWLDWTQSYFKLVYFRLLFLQLLLKCCMSFFSLVCLLFQLRFQRFNLVLKTSHLHFKLIVLNFKLDVCLLQVLQNLKLVLSYSWWLELLLDYAYIFNVLLQLQSLALVKVLLVNKVCKFDLIDLKLWRKWLKFTFLSWKLVHRLIVLLSGCMQLSCEVLVFILELSHKWCPLSYAFLQITYLALQQFYLFVVQLGRMHVALLNVNFCFFLFSLSSLNF